MVTVPEGEAHGASRVANFMRVAGVERLNGPSFGETNLEGKTPETDPG
jgi:hypothetical protein